MAEQVDTVAYQQITRSLWYLIHRWSYLAFSVGYVRLFMEQRTVEHMGVVKCLLYHIADTIVYDLIYPHGLGVAKMVG